MSRQTQSLSFVHSVLNDADVTIAPASADASFRSYWRTSVTAKTPQSYVLMDAPPEREDIRPWLDVAHRLAQVGVHAPRIVAEDAEQGFVLMEDLGNQTLLSVLNEVNVDDFYLESLRLMQRMQTGADTDGLPAYDEKRLIDEMELLPKWFLGEHLGFSPSCEQWDVIEAAFLALAQSALRQPKVFVHRDFHSRNLMCTGDGLALIDFQDAVRGPMTYDLVSLLRDCYIAWSDEQVATWVHVYRTEAVKAGLTDADEATFTRWFDLMGLQRHIKVLGIFCRLWYRDGKDGYLNDLPLVWQYVQQVGSRYDETKDLVALIAEVLGTRDITKVAS